MLVPNYQIPKRSLKFWWKIFKVPENTPDLFIAFPHPGDWQDDVRSSLYCHFWCSYIWTTSLVVWSPQMTRQTWVRFPGRSIFWNFKISIPMTFSHVQGHIYHNLDWNYHNHRGLVGVGVGLMTLRSLVRSHVGRIRDLINPVRRAEVGQAGTVE